MKKPDLNIDWTFEIKVKLGEGAHRCRSGYRGIPRRLRFQQGTKRSRFFYVIEQLAGRYSACRRSEFYYLIWNTLEKLEEDDYFFAVTDNSGKDHYDDPILRSYDPADTSPFEISW
jgi:hypothetical protein